MKKPLLIFFIIFAHLALAQYGNSAKITVFKSDNTSPKPVSVTKKDSLAGHDKVCLKWNYSLILRGVFLLNGEFRIAGNLTAEVGLGLTYRDYVFELTHSTVNGNDGIWGTDNTGSPSLNIAAEAGARYYMSGFDNFEGIYVQGTISYRAYSFPNAPDIALAGNTLVPGYNFLDGQFKIGYQAMGYYSDFTYDFYFGVGYRSATLNYYVVTSGPNSIGNYQTTYVPQTVSESFPQFLFGMKIGYAF